MSKDSYSKITAELHEIVAKLQDPTTSIDQLPAMLKRAKTLIAASKTKLRNIEVDISHLFSGYEEEE